MDLSRGYVHGYNAVIVPLETGLNIWYFTYPFTNTVWLLMVTSIPFYIIAMGLTHYLYNGSADWDTLSGFVLRNALSEQTGTIPDQSKTYHKILIITWVGFTLILVYAYAGSLTAMLSKPILQNPIKTLEELARQNKIPWVIEQGSTAEFNMRTALSGSTMSLLHKQAVLVPHLTRREINKYGCPTAKLRGKGRFASFCQWSVIWLMMAKDFSATGKCNFYLIEERLISSMRGAAFQVNIFICYNYASHLSFWTKFQMGSPFLEDFNYLVDLKDQMGLKLSEDAIEDYVPNTTKCMTWQDVKASHDYVTTPVVKVKDFYGIFILLILGLGIAMASLTIECLTKALMLRHKKTTRSHNP